MKEKTPLQFKMANYNTSFSVITSTSCYHAQYIYIVLQTSRIFYVNDVKKVDDHLKLQPRENQNITIYSNASN